MIRVRIVDTPAPEPTHDLPVGEIMRRARLGYGMELPFVSTRLNIRLEHLEAIEAGDASRLPGRVYAIGFVRAYADFLQLESDKIVYLFKSQCIGHDVRRELSFPVPVTESRAPAVWMVIASVCVVAAVIAGFVMLQGKQPDHMTPALPTDVAAELEAHTAPEQAEPEADTAPPEKQDAKTFDEVVEKAAAPEPTPSLPLTLKAREASWVELRPADNPDKILISRVLKAGESYTTVAMDAVILSTGNAEAVDVYWGKQPVDVLKGRTGVVRNLPVSRLAMYKTKETPNE